MKSPFFGHIMAHNSSVLILQETVDYRTKARKNKQNMKQNNTRLNPYFLRIIWIEFNETTDF